MVCVQQVVTPGLPRNIFLPTITWYVLGEICIRGCCLHFPPPVVYFQTILVHSYNTQGQIKASLIGLFFFFFSLFAIVDLGPDSFVVAW